MQRHPRTLSVGTRPAPRVQLAPSTPRSRAVARFYTPTSWWLALGLLGLATALLLYHETRGTTLWFDEWIWVVQRRGCTLVFAYARRRVGEVIAALVTLLLLLFGPGWQGFLWPFQITWLISLASGIGALLALERDGPRSSLVACGLLVISLASSGVGVPFALWALVELALSRA